MLATFSLSARTETAKAVTTRIVRKSFLRDNGHCLALQKLDCFSVSPQTSILVVHGTQLPRSRVSDVPRG